MWSSCMYSSASVSNTNQYISALPIISIIEIFVIFLIEDTALKTCRCRSFVPHNQCRHLFLQCSVALCLHQKHSGGGGSLWPTHHVLHDCLLLSSLQNLPCTRWENKAGTVDCFWFVLEVDDHCTDSENSAILNQKVRKKTTTHNGYTVINRIFNNNIHVFKKKKKSAIHDYKSLRPPMYTCQNHNIWISYSKLFFGRC